jgi:enoyl-CoA hydratase/carnithine racemase
LDRCQADDAVQSIILTGAGDRAFCSGHDLNESDSEVSGPEEAAFFKPRTLSKPCIAAVNGAARAGGLVLALSCDIRVCDPAATLAANAAQLGMFPLGPQISRFMEIVPEPIAFELLVTGRVCDANEALRLALVNRLAKPGAALESALSLAAEIGACSPAVVQAVKRAFQIREADGAAATDRFADDIGRELADGPDAKEGIRAFLEKRKPRFQKATTVN